MQKLEIVREKIESKYRVVKSDVDLEWNRAIDLCMNIINAHISRENTPEITRSSRDSQFGECSQREVYMKAYEDALNEDSVSEAFLADCKRVAQKYKKDNDGWVSVEDRLPEKNEYFVDTSSNKEFPNGYYRRLEIAYMTDTVEYIHGYYDGYKWMDEYLDAIKNVVAWRIHEPYRPERSRENEN